MSMPLMSIHNPVIGSGGFQIAGRIKQGKYRGDGQCALLHQAGIGKTDDDHQSFYHEHPHKGMGKRAQEGQPEHEKNLLDSLPA